MVGFGDGLVALVPRRFRRIAVATEDPRAQGVGLRESGGHPMPDCVGLRMAVKEQKRRPPVPSPLVTTGGPERLVRFDPLAPTAGERWGLPSTVAA